jgi:hypothetical protein
MLSFIKLSERRFLVINVPVKPNSYQSSEEDPDKGFLSARAEMITVKPVSWSEARKVASRWAAEHKLLVTPEQWRELSK